MRNFIINIIKGLINLIDAIHRHYEDIKKQKEIVPDSVLPPMTPVQPVSIKTNKTYDGFIINPPKISSAGEDLTKKQGIILMIRRIATYKGISGNNLVNLLATIECESKDFELDCINENKKNGVVLSYDAGLCQWNNYYHGKEITPEQAINNPEKAVALMCDYWKRGSYNTWICFKGGWYQQYCKNFK